MAYGHRLVVRNGYHAEREVSTAAGALVVRAPRVNDKRIEETTGDLPTEPFHGGVVDHLEHGRTFLN